MSVPKIAIIFTGGTISMSVDPRMNAAIPTLSGSQIMSLVTNIDRFATLENIEYASLPGPQIGPKEMMDIRRVVLEQLAKDDIDGVIITHGTDTLEETAYLLDLTIKNDKAIIVVGAMRNSSELGYDGPSNLAAAVCTAISPESKGKGVLVVMNNTVNAASEVTKTNTLSLDTFQSMGFGPLGIIDNDVLLLHRNVIHRQFIPTDSIEPRVDLIKCSAGSDSRLIRFCVDDGARGIVIEALGRGNVPPQVLDGISYAIKNNVVVVIVSRCPTGRVLDTYGYDGGGRQIRELGAILGGDLPGQKARIKLMLALTISDNIETIRNLF